MPPSGARLDPVFLGGPRYVRIEGGEPLPSGGTPLRQAELDAVERWIAAGAMP